MIEQEILAQVTPTQRPMDGLRADVVVIGAGMAGLAAANVLHQRGLEPVVVEQEARAGGRLRTLEVGGAAVDVGAGFVTKAHGRTLAMFAAHHKDAGMVPCRLATSVVTPSGALRLTPGGTPRLARVLGPHAAVEIASHLVRVGLAWRSLSPSDPRKWATAADGSLAEYGLRSLDPDLMSLLVEPVIRGFLYWEPERTAAAMLYVLTRTALTMGRILVPTMGLGATAADIGEHLCVRVNTRATGLERTPQGDWLVRLAGPDRPRSLVSQRVLLAVPAHEAARLVPEEFASTRQWLSRVTYRAATTTVVRTAVPIPAREAAVFITRSLHPRLVLASAASGRAASLRPSVGDVLTLYSTSDRTSDKSPDDLALLLSLLPRTYRAPVVGDPVQTDWASALPEFDEEHLVRLSRLDLKPLSSKGLFLAGDYLCAPFIEGAVASGEAAATAILKG